MNKLTKVKLLVYTPLSFFIILALGLIWTGIVGIQNKHIQLLVGKAYRHRGVTWAGGTEAIVFGIVYIVLGVVLLGFFTRLILQMRRSVKKNQTTIDNQK